MSSSNYSEPAVFISYASQDREAARQIQDALQAAGIEVWFDESALRGGDAWDAFIREQLGRCALFLPLVTRATNDRAEGYFRLEWKLAVDRSHRMADDQAFIVPVALGDVDETTARVPFEFRTRQWLRLSRASECAALVERIGHLLGRAAEPARTADQEVPSDLSIVVLPFSFLGPQRDHSYIADGLTDEIITDLSKIGALRVISRTSSMAIRNRNEAAPSLARLLGVRYLLEGTVRQAEERLKISVRLLDPHEDRQVWVERFEGTLEEVFEIQERIARETAEALRVKINDREDARIARRPVDHLQAWQCAQQARQEALRWRPDAIARAIQLLENGIALVGDNPSLLAALGRAHLQYREAGIDLSPEPLRQAEALARRILESDPESIEGLALRGWLRFARGEIQDAVDDLERVVAHDPGQVDTLILLAYCLLISGRVSEARPMIRRALSIDPLTPLNHCLPGWADALEGHPQRAVAAYEKMFSMDAGNPVARLFYFWILVCAGQIDAARSLVEDFPAEAAATPAAVIARLYWRAVAGTPAGELEDPPREIQALANTSEMFPRLIAQAYATAGDARRAVRWLRAAVARGFINYPYLAEHDPAFSALRGDEGYEALLAEVRARWQAFRV